MTTNSELTYADLEIRILKRGETGYPVEITLNPDAYYKRGFLSPDLPTEGDARQMGARLTAWFFVDATLKAAWEYARGRYPRRRIRLCLDEDVPELHGLSWEALRDSENGLDLAAADATPFSRFLAGEWQGYDPVSTRPVKMLAVIANPDDLGRYNLAALDEEAEWAILREAMEGLEVTLTRLPSPCTLTAIERELRQGYHVLHIIAHGAYSERRGQAALYLVDAKNHVQIVREDAFAAMLARQLSDAGGHNPDYVRLVFLASCQSATRHTAEAFRGLAPALVKARVPAVVAMQDTVSIAAARTFSHAFYEGLVRHGLVDLAGNQARATLLTSGSGEAATPVIFMRGSGKLFDPQAHGQQHIARKPFEPETVYIPAGPFLMGSPSGEGIPDRETPQHEVTLPAYRIGKYPVTNAQYAEFLNRERAQDDLALRMYAGWDHGEPPADKLDHPVVCVSWYDALAYCRWLCEATGRSYHLPTEAEWEKAARGTRGQIYPWGDGWEKDRCNAEGQGTTPVTAYPQGVSPYGCWDMVGNVQEWTSTMGGSEQQSFAYPYRVDDGREDLHAGDYLSRVWRVCRGGSYRDGQSKLRSSARRRASSPKSNEIRWRGFRVVLDV